MTAFDGPGPFDSDAVYHYLDEAAVPPIAFREMVGDAFQEIISGGAARRAPPEILAMLGVETPSSYVDVDEGVWAWACAELVASALGIEPESPIPDVFFQRAQAMPAPAGLIPNALRALEIISDPKRSELAGMLKDGDNQDAFQRMERLRLRLAERRLSVL